ncbi:MAG: DUF2934 domain-containing protein [Bryobacteraceae bacterium]
MDDIIQRRERIRLLAYTLWQERGCPKGTPEIDWFRAESELREADSDVNEQPSIVTAAKLIGSALGSVAGIVTSLGSTSDAGTAHDE